MKINLKQLSSLEKVFLTNNQEWEEITHASVLKGEKFSYQIAYICDGDIKVDARLKIESDLIDCISVYKIGNVPSELPVFTQLLDSKYIRTEPGLFPDVLYPMDVKAGEEFEIINKKRHAIWITASINPETKAGIYPIKIVFEPSENNDNNTEISKTFELEVIDAVLPKQTLIHTEWFHADCIAVQYNLEMLSREHWEMIEKFIKMAVDGGINMILTPIFTPPLDTKVGGERPTIQLVDVSKNGSKYSFGFENLEKWIDMCLKNGVEYFEMSHLFSQWGAKYCPKIMATVDGEYKQIFGWNNEAICPEYDEFLKTFLPNLTNFLETKGIDKVTYFHISDEPLSEEHKETYEKAKNIVADLLKNYKIIDALSEVDFYTSGLVENPIPSNDHIHKFIESGAKNLWTYYCCAQCVDVSNRFMSMPSYRNRILGTQLYKYDIIGFLQWGYNFYYSQYSKRKINPFLVTDADSAFPSGDSFLVYPDADSPIPSIRYMVLREALQDMRAMQLLEKAIGKDAVLKIIECDEITFKNYPCNSEYILNMRERINQAIKSL
ncbi:MAG: DUF4091 domain-containing protein [Oscillospiraceae bacterium]